MRRRPPRAAQLFLIAFGLLLSFVLLEGSLRLYSVLAAADPEPTIPDEQLAHRPNPAYSGHDSRGWRNVSALAEADVVALGDSQTYGINAAPGEAWPQRLAVHLRRRVYQMAYGGYGPAHYVPLLDEVLKLRPKVILAAYYFGNDVYDSYWLVYGSKRPSSDPILHTLASNDLNMRAALAQADIRDPKDVRVGYLDCGSPPLQGADPDRLLREPISRPRKEVEKQVPASPAGPRHILSQLSHHSLVFQTAWPRLRPRLTFLLGKPLVLRDYGPPLCVHYDDGVVRTVFNVGYRYVVLDERDPRGVEGERISLVAFQHLADRSRHAGIHFFVVLIPTKETAFRARAEASLRNEPYLFDLWHAEARARTRAVAFLRREGIRTIDTLPALEAMIASGVNPYLENADGHPVDRGYDAIARAVAARLQRDAAEGQR